MISKLVFRKLFLSFCIFYISHLAAAPIAYSVHLNGVTGKNIVKEIKSSSKLFQSNKEAVSTSIALINMADKDQATIARILQNYGYLEAVVTPSIQQVDNAYNITFDVKRGARYTVENIVLLPSEASNLNREQFEKISSRLPFKKGEIINADKVLSAQGSIVSSLASFGYPFASIDSFEIRIDRKRHQASIFYYFQLKDLAYYGPVTILGDSAALKERYWPYYIRWSRDERFSKNKIEETQKALNATGVFSSVQVSYSEDLLNRDTLPITIEVREAEPKSIGIGAAFSTEFGVGGVFEWAHHNLSRKADELLFQTEIHEYIRKLMLQYSLPFYPFHDTSIVFSSEVESKVSESYESDNATAKTVLQSKIRKNLLVSAGIETEYLKEKVKSQVKPTIDSTYHLLLRFPVKLYWDLTNDLVNPDEGVRFRYFFAPTISFDPKKSFHKHRINLSFYYPFDFFSKKIVMAYQIQLNSIIGSSLVNIPISERIFFGGSDNLRGFKYESVSRLVNNKPVGGLSGIIHTIELRQNLTNQLGAVVFCDTGQVYETTFPTTNRGKYLTSVGAGLVYSSLIGPLRLDLAIPLTRRKRFQSSKFIDEPFQIYFSIDHAF